MPWYGYALLSALAIAAVGFLQKRNLQHEHSTEYVTVFSAIKLLLFLLIFGGRVEWSVSSNQLTWLLIDGALLSLAFYFVAKAMRRLELSTVMPALSLEPGLTALLALVFLREVIGGGQVFGLALLLIGTYVLELQRHDRAWASWFRSPRAFGNPFRQLLAKPGGGYALAGLLFFALSSVVDRWLLQQVPTATYLGYVLSVMTAVYVIRFFLIREQLVVFKKSNRPLLITIIAIAGLHLLSNYTQAQAIGLASVGLVIALKRLSTLLDVVIGGKFFHEQNLAQKSVASVIMLIGAYFIVAT